MRVAVFMTLLGLALASPVDKKEEQVQEAEARSASINPSPQDPVRRDGAHHGGGHGSFQVSTASGHSSYSGAAAPVQSFGGHSKGHVSKGHHAGNSVGHSSGGYVGGGHHVAQNHISGSSGGSYGAPVQQHHQATYEPPKHTGYYYYYYPVTIQDDKKSSDKGFFGKMKKLFEPMMYPWNAMMDYFGYGDDYDYDYDSYGHYRSITSRASDYVPWDAVNELGNHVTQDQCIEFYMCELGTYGRQYKALHFLLDYFLPESSINEYSRSFKDSIRSQKDCFNSYSCPIIRREPFPQ